MSTELVVKEKKKEKEREKPLFSKLELPSKRKVILKSDGIIYGATNPYGAILSSPLSQEEIYYEFTGEMDKSKIPKPSPLLLQIPDIKYKVPLEFVRVWARQLLEYETEALCVYGVHRRDPAQWLAVVPEQEVTSSSVDVDEFGKAVQTLSSKGYRTVGTLHTHPGNMSACSKTDTDELWNKFAGIHLIVTSTGVLSWYFSSRTITWNLNSYEGFKKIELFEKDKIPAALKNGHKWLKGEDGGRRYDQFIKEKTYRQTVTYGGWWDQGYSGTRSKTGYKTYERIYSGKWSQTHRTWIYEKQKDGQRVDKDYSELYPAHYDVFHSTWYAGKPLKKNKKRYICKNPSSEDRRAVRACRIEDIEGEKKKEKKDTRAEPLKLESFAQVTDILMGGETDLELSDWDTRMAIEEEITELVMVFQGLKDSLHTALVEGEEDTKAIEVYKALTPLMIKMEDLLWGSLADDKKTYNDIFGKE